MKSVKIGTLVLAGAVALGLAAPSAALADSGQAPQQPCSVQVLYHSPQYISAQPVGTGCYRPTVSVQAWWVASPTGGSATLVDALYGNLDGSTYERTIDLETSTAGNYVGFPAAYSCYWEETVSYGLPAASPDAIGSDLIASYFGGSQDCQASTSPAPVAAPAAPSQPVQAVTAPAKAKVKKVAKVKTHKHYGWPTWYTWRQSR
jgi:hypothetical protein